SLPCLPIPLALRRLKPRQEQLRSKRGREAPARRPRVQLLTCRALRRTVTVPSLRIPSSSHSPVDASPGNHQACPIARPAGYACPQRGKRTVPEQERCRAPAPAKQAKKGKLLRFPPWTVHKAASCRTTFCDDQPICAAGTSMGSIP